MRRLFASLAITTLLGGCVTAIETVNIPTDPSGWKFGSGSNRRGQTIAEFVPHDESIDNWTRLLTIQFLETEIRSPAVVMDDLKSKMQARCPDSYWSIINQDSVSILYEWNIKNCSLNPDQHEIARLLKGNDGLHRVAYTELTTAINPSTREKWITSFKEAYVEKNGKKVVLNH